MIPPRKGQINRGLMPGRRGIRIFRLLRDQRGAVQGQTAASARAILSLALAEGEAEPSAIEVGGRIRRRDPARPVPSQWRLTTATTLSWRPSSGTTAPSESRNSSSWICRSDGGLAAHLHGRPSCTVWRPLDLGKPEPVTLWLNGLRTRYAEGRWCLSLDTSDAFVFYRCEDRQDRRSDRVSGLGASRPPLCGNGGNVRVRAGRVAGASSPMGRRPSTLLDHFDPFGFVTLDPGRFHNVIVRGGLQRRRPVQDTASSKPCAQSHSTGQMAMELCLCGRHAPHPAHASQSTACTVAFEPNGLHPAVRASERSSDPRRRGQVGARGGNERRRARDPTRACPGCATCL